jgi:hypothetical protein
VRLPLAALVLSLAAAPARATPGPAPAPPSSPGGTVAPALAAAAEALAREVGPPAEGRRALLLQVEARAAALRAPLETALDGALAARGYAVTPHRGAADAEQSARGAGQDWLLRVRAGLVPGRRELALVGELIPAWASFFLQRHPAARAIPPRIVQARTAADPETLLLGREAAPPGAPFATIRTLARVPGRVLAVAVGEPEEPGRPAIVAATADALVVLSAAGQRIAERSAAAPVRPVRDPAAAVAVGDLGGGRIALFRAGAARGEVLALRGGRLETAGVLDAAPLCAGGAGTLFGAFEPGTGVLRDQLATLVDPAAAPRSSRTLYGAACAPRPGAIAFAVLGTELRLEVLDRDLRPVAGAREAGSREPVTGSGFALADLDGDGSPELVASSADPDGAERIRILAPLAPGAPLAETAVAGSVLAGAAGDLTGDGVDDALLAAVLAGPDGAAVTDLLLVTSDPREGTP